MDVKPVSIKSLEEAARVMENLGEVRFTEKILDMKELKKDWLYIPDGILNQVRNISDDIMEEFKKLESKQVDAMLDSEKIIDSSIGTILED